MLSAATTLRKSHPIARHSYDDETASPFADWLKAYDFTFNAGSWLVDHKDEVPENAKVNFMGPRVGNVHSILDAHYLHRDPALVESAIQKLERQTKL
jgi:hypothetical protein